MEKKFIYNHITAIILAFGLVFSYPLPFINMNWQQYIFIGPILLAFFIDLFILKRKSFEPSLFLITIIILIIYLIKSFTFGISAGSLIPLFGIMLIPVSVIIFISINRVDIYQILMYFVLLFTIFEILVLIYLIFCGYFLSSDYTGVTLLRDRISYDWPNYFAMLSALKIGIINYLMKKEYLKSKLIFIFSFISLILIVGSVSRTALIMVVIIFLIPVLYSILFNSNRKRVTKIIIISSLFFGTILLGGLVFLFKGANRGATLTRTLEARFGKWNEVFDVVSNNTIFGIGFRSTTNFVEGIGSTHNDYIDILLKGGIVFFVIFYGYIARRLVILIKNREIQLTALILSIMVGGFVQNPLKKSSFIILFAIFLALSYKTYKDKKLKTSENKVINTNE